MSTDTSDMSTDPVDGSPREPLPPQGPRVGERLRRFNGRVLALARRLNWRVASVVLVAVLSIAVWRAITSPAKTPTATMAAAAAQSVAVARVSREDLYNEVTIPAEFRPYLKVELHAKVSGYVDQINVDIGDQVKTGQLLARLEVPELSDELTRATAAEQQAEASYKNAHLVYTRLQAVNKDRPNLVAQQELDTAEARDRTTEAAIAGAKADVEKYQTLVDYTRITAPFDGVITHRYADPGSLIQAGTASDTQSMPLVCLSDNYRLRLDFPVSVAYVKDIQLGDQVEVRVESLKGKPFTGTISRSTQKVDEDTRTMITELDVPNPKLELVPGMYATVVLKVERRPNALVVPTEAVSTEKGTLVYLIGNGDRIEEQPVTLGLEMPGKYEVLSGLKEGDLVLVGSHSQIKLGQKVEPKLIGSLAQQ
ncbi:MAG TPA: efflux RND transporter periplasmic adaptor subunit [Candidatus Acidoferrum sp.]|jgi:RND family efflux transporter MFP subunit|nr:efflux RND transporter periplasmic adaptor subunit [Candidatus Acidoferrum sp.]